MQFLETKCAIKNKKNQLHKYSATYKPAVTVTEDTVQYSNTTY